MSERMIMRNIQGAVEKGRGGAETEAPDGCGGVL